MNKTELIAAIAEKSELTKKDAEKALKAFTDVVADELKKGEKIQLVGFGTFEVSERAAREGRNPQTGRNHEDCSFQDSEVQSRKGSERQPELKNTGYAGRHSENATGCGRIPGILPHSFCFAKKFREKWEEKK